MTDDALPTTDSNDDPRARFERALREAWSAGASDVHFLAGHAPRARTSEGLVPLREAPLDGPALLAVATSLLGASRVARLPDDGVVSASFRIDGQRFGRATLSSSLGEPSLGVRFRTAGAVVTLDAIGGPPGIAALCDESHGLVVVAGPHGSGKTTMLYALLDRINQTRAVHICTVEDPVSLELTSAKALVQQREVGTDVPDVARGIAAALDQDLDVLVVNQLTDLESLTAALHAATTGHLVILQVHADDARDALARLVEAAPTSMHAHVRRTLAEALRGVVAQRLVPRSPRGRVAIHEVLLPDDALRAALREGRPLGPGGPGSVTIAEEVARHEADGRISADTARAVHEAAGRIIGARLSRL